MKPSTETDLAAKLLEIEKLLSRPDPRPEVADRIMDIMSTAQGAGANTATSSFILGQVFEILKPMRDVKTLKASRDRVKKELEKLTLAADE